MTRNIAIKLKYLKFRGEIVMRFLLLLFTWSNKFKVSNLYIADPILIKGNHTRVFWNCRDVYKIRVKNIGSYPGNKNSFIVPLRTSEIPIEITFYGIFKKVKREIILIPQEVKVIQQDFFYRPNSRIKAVVPALQNFKTVSSIINPSKLAGISSTLKAGLASKIKLNPFNIKYFKQMYYGK